MTTSLATRPIPTSERTRPAMPEIGDRYGCRICGMEIEIIADCACKDPQDFQFECCGQKMKRT